MFYYHYSSKHLLFKKNVISINRLQASKLNLVGFDALTGHTVNDAIATRIHIPHNSSGDVKCDSNDDH